VRSNQYKPMRRYRCMMCGRYVGNSNLGGYMTDKTSKRGVSAYCERCVGRLLTKDGAE